MASLTSASSASPLIETSLLPQAASTACRRDVRFVAFRPSSTVIPGGKLHFGFIDSTDISDDKITGFAGVLFPTHDL